MKLYEDEQVPADILAITSSETNGDVYVTTATLDGERALKHKQVIHEIQDYVLGDPTHLNASAHIEKPHKSLYNFSGYLEFLPKGQQ